MLSCGDDSPFIRGTNPNIFPGETEMKKLRSKT